MKMLTYSAMAAARLRANKRSYRSLVLGIFLSIFLISTFVVGVYGIYLGQQQKRYDKVGVLDMVILDNELLTDEAVMAMGDYDRLGHAYVTGRVSETNVYLGHYDKTAASLLGLSPVDGRMPEQDGEIAVEASALEVLEAQVSLGDPLELAVVPVDGVEELRVFTLVGILPERSVHLEKSDHVSVTQFPAIVTSPGEPSFSTGRVASHTLLGLKEGVFLGDAIARFWERYLRPGLSSAMFGLSISGQQVQTFSSGELFYVENEMMSLITMAAVLAAALILSCGVGISGAMEGVLSKRREEIGVLRALGATRRQIRRMFGRENLIIALIVSPIAMAVGCGAVWVLSRMMPGLVRFGLNLWLLLPIIAFSVITVLISGYLPLVRASKLMPMSVIRDTRMLRRSKGVKSKTAFSAPKLIAARQLRFNPTRQIGAAVLVGLMLLSSGLLAGIVTGYSRYTMSELPGFRIMTDGYSSDLKLPLYSTDPMSPQSIRQIRSLDHVSSLRIDRELFVYTDLPQVPGYAKLNTMIDQFWMLDEEQFREAMEATGMENFWYEEQYASEREEYLKFLKEYDFDGHAFRTAIVTIEPTQKNLDALKQYLGEGTIDVAALDSGTQVLVYAPDIWVKNHEGGSYSFHTSQRSLEEDPYPGHVAITAENDSFYTGQTLELTQLYRTQAEGAVTRKDVAVQVSGIIKELEQELVDLWSITAVITTEKGLENMGLRMEGLNGIDVFLDDEVTLEQEKLLEKQLTAIARRTDGLSVFNQMESMRKSKQEDVQQLLVFVCIITAFFASAAGMIVSSVTRQLHSEGRTIGMLRAVGADEKDILNCYCGQLNAAITGGLGVCGGVLLLYLLLYLLDALSMPFFRLDMDLVWQWAAVLAAVSVMAILCWLLCRFVLGLRIKEIVRKSIIDNIREL